MYILKVAYDGRYSFQSQPHRNTVVDVLMDALKECGYLKGEKVIFSGGRTDKGVSALGNFVVVELNKEPILSFIYSKLRGKGIWVLGYKEIDEIPKVEYRHYRYILPNEGYDIELMREASKKLIGTHSFHNLSKKDRSKERSPIRTIYDIKIEANEYFITIDVIGESFLWNMVRKIVTALSYVGSGKKPVDWIDKLLDENHREGVPTFPPDGLILVEAKVDVDYIYDNYSIRKFKEYWEEFFKLQVMKLGIAKTVLEFI